MGGFPFELEADFLEEGVGLGGVLACKVFQHVAAFLICLMVMMLAAAQSRD